MYRTTCILLSLLLWLRSAAPIAAQTASTDSLASSPNPLTILLPGMLYASYPTSHIDEPMRQARHSLLGREWRNHYDDYMQYTPYALQLSMRAAGAAGRSRSWGEMLTADGVAAASMAALVLSVKKGVHRMRPDGSTANSFPSGHTATAFLGAELFNIEYGAEYPLLANAQYLLATSVALGRIANDRHWYSDVLWGGLVGVSTARLGYLVSDLIFGRYRATDYLEEGRGAYIALQQSYLLGHRYGGSALGLQIGYQTATLYYALELAAVPHGVQTSGYCDLLVGASIHAWRYARLRQCYGIGIGHERDYDKGSYAHLQAGVELQPLVRYLDRMALTLRMHYEPYRQSYLSLGISLRHHCW